eukprot:CAMPEP_0181319728 /NCGR_PEP_ID=MMETSP1101-20121128/17733_1 /TAXON_ID=46948 /ORGANISM="Rhodomonas abbreviata, Strain Caron Lab Isolate" /LENGTH=61 /DNA_ID=CAMNT_0023427361 /DNA_START=182 /DNA_END=367 /DNA_ORIENTATION=-
MEPCALYENPQAISGSHAGFLEPGAGEGRCPICPQDCSSLAQAQSSPAVTRAQTHRPCAAQ